MRLALIAAFIIALTGTASAGNSSSTLPIPDQPPPYLIIHRNGKVFWGQPSTQSFASKSDCESGLSNNKGPYQTYKGKYLFECTYHRAAKSWSLDIYSDQPPQVQPLTLPDLDPMTRRQASRTISFADHDGHDQERCETTRANLIAQGKITKQYHLLCEHIGTDAIQKRVYPDPKENPYQYDTWNLGFYALDPPAQAGAK